jgi:hypothetical protein
MCGRDGNQDGRPGRLGRVLVALASWSETTPALWCAVAATVGAGLLVGRWWALLVPTVLALVLVVGVLASGQDPGERWESTPENYALAYLAAWAITVALLAVGVAVHKMVAAASGSRLTSSADGSGRSA